MHHPNFSTKSRRMGCVIRLSAASAQYYTVDDVTVRSLESPWNAPDRYSIFPSGCWLSSLVPPAWWPIGKPFAWSAIGSSDGHTPLTVSREYDAKVAALLRKAGGKE